MNFFRHIFGKTQSNIQIQEIPTAPIGWNLTIADLMREMNDGKRKSVGSPEIDWARDYERSLLPSNTRFPTRGDVYETILDVEVDYMTAWQAPFTGGGKALIRKGERIWIDSAPNSPCPVSVYAVAMRYEALELEVVPASDRENPKYNGYYFSIKTVDLNTRYRLVDKNYKTQQRSQPFVLPQFSE